MQVRLRACRSIPGLGRSPGEGNGNPLQYSCLENLIDRGAWQATVHRAGRDCSNLTWLKNRGNPRPWSSTAHWSFSVSHSSWGSSSACLHHAEQRYTSTQVGEWSQRSLPPALLQTHTRPASFMFPINCSDHRLSHCTLSSHFPPQLIQNSVQRGFNLAPQGSTEKYWVGQKFCSGFSITSYVEPVSWAYYSSFTEARSLWADGTELTVEVNHPLPPVWPSLGYRLCPRLGPKAEFIHSTNISECWPCVRHHSLFWGYSTE